MKKIIKNIGREKNLIEFISKNDDSAVRKNCMVDINFVNYRVQIFHLHKRVEKIRKIARNFTAITLKHEIKWLLV